MEVNYINSFQSRNYLDSAIKNGLKVLPFTEVFDDISSQFIKIKLKEINNSGMYPVIDQSEEFISGYTDDIPKSKAKRNVIVFGDHTKILKYVDFPFIKGADGVKVLSLRNENHNIKYFYYFLKTLNLPDLGYSRYYKILKESYIPVPNIQLQNKFVNIFDSIENLIQTRQDQIQALDDLVESTFVQFINEYEIKNTLLDYIFEFIDGDRGKNYPKSDDLLKEGYCLFLNAKNVTLSGFKFDDLEFISKERDELLRKGKLKRGDIILTTRGTVGNIAYYDDSVDFENVRINSGMVILRKKININPIYFQEIIRNTHVLESGMSGSAQPQLPIRNLKNIKVPIIDIEKQNLFAAFVEKIEGQKEILNRSLEELRDLFDSLMQDAFDGSMVK